MSHWLFIPYFVLHNFCELKKSYVDPEVVRELYKLHIDMASDHVVDQVLAENTDEGEITQNTL